MSGCSWSGFRLAFPVSGGLIGVASDASLFERESSVSVGDRPIAWEIWLPEMKWNKSDGCTHSHLIGNGTVMSYGLFQTPLMKIFQIQRQIELHGGIKGVGVI